MKIAGLILAAYLLGSIPTSLWLARYVKGIDLRRWGSGNLGATNLYRAVGPGLALVAVVVDVAKGFVPAWFFPQLDAAAAPQWALAYGVAAVLGHIFSIWAGFRGGKGVATGGGFYLALAPLAVGLGLVAWAALVITVRIASIASLLAASLLPGLVWVSGHRSDYVFWASLPLAALVWWTHRSNIARLMAGEEPRVARGSGAPPHRPQDGEMRNPATRV